MMKALALICLIALSTAHVEFTYTDYEDDRGFTPAAKLVGSSAIPAAVAFLSTLKETKEVWGTIKDMFSAQRSCKIKETLLDQGYQTFALNANVDFSWGVNEEDIPEFLESVSRKWNIKPEGGLTIKEVMQMKLLAGKSAWAEYDIIGSDDKGNTKFNAIHIAFEDGKYHFIKTTISVGFQFAPNINVIEKKLSVMGGLFEEEKTIREEIPRYVKYEDLKTVIQFFNIIIFNRLGKEYGVYLDLPKVNK
jgi:hypothetical protein